MTRNAPRATQRRRWRRVPPLLGTAILALASASGADAPTVLLGGQALDPGQISAGVELCQRDAPELPLVRCFSEAILPLLRLEREAQRRKLPESERGQRLLTGVLYGALYEQVERAQQVSDEQLRAFIAQHQRDFEQPERLRLFRILVASREEAQALLAKLSADTTPADFRALCRAHSKDNATLERGGDLGFVWPDGTTDVPQLRANAALYAAAQPVADGAFVPQPVAEGEQFAVVWRRGSLPAVHVAADQAEALARSRLLEQRTVAALDALVEQAKPELHPELLAKLHRPDSKLFTP